MPVHAPMYDFYFQPYAGHDDLHSFPTRRSSDLARQPPLAQPPPLRTPPGASHTGRARLRSEEHTSELQSRLHLVCRLLLEKKKSAQLDDVAVHYVYREKSTHFCLKTLRTINARA